MTRIVVAVVMAGLFAAVGLSPAEAGKSRKKKTREETDTYMVPAIGSADATGTCGIDCTRFATSTTERFMTIKVEEASGTTPAITIGQDTVEGDGFVERVAEVCGESVAPIPITPGAEVVVWVWATPSVLNNCNGIGTTGTITAVFSNRP